MKRLPPSLRRPLSLLAALALGVLAALSIAAPASAHDIKLSGSATCNDATGKWQVQWTITNDWNTDATIDVFTASNSAPITDRHNTEAVAVGTVIPAARQGVSDGSLVATQTIDGSVTNDETLTVHTVWPDDDYKGAPTHTATVHLAGGCQQTTPECVAVTASAFDHTLTPSTDGTGYDATVRVHGDKPLCTAQPFTLVSYYAPSATFTTPQYEFDHDFVPAGQPNTTVIDKDHPSVNLHVAIPKCFTQVDLIIGTDKDIINPLTKNGPRYHDKHILLDAANGGKDSCAAPVFKSNCDGSVEVDLPAAGHQDVTFTVTDAKGSTDYLVKANTTHAPITIPAGAASMITVSIGGEQIASGHWTQPAKCASPTIAAVSDCDSLSVTVTNPAGNKAIDAKIVAGTKTATVHVPAGTTSAPQRFPVSGTKLTATVTIGDLVLTGTFHKPANCAGSGGGLPVTGVNSLAFVGVALALIGGGMGLILVSRRRRGQSAE